MSKHKICQIESTLVTFRENTNEQRDRISKLTSKIKTNSIKLSPKGSSKLKFPWYNYDTDKLSLIKLSLEKTCHWSKFNDTLKYFVLEVDAIL